MRKEATAAVRAAAGLSLSARGLSKQVWDGERQRQILAGVDLQMRPGQFIALVGPSGCGKTTLLNILGAMDRPSGGEVWVGGQEITRLGERRLAQVRNRQIGMVFQFFHLLDQLSVQENVELPLRLAGVPSGETGERVRSLLAQAGLELLRHRSPAGLSGGEKQRVAIVRALINQPAVVLADEPTGNLDEETGQEIIELMVGMTAGLGSSLLIVTHNKALAVRADAVYRLREGQLARQ